MVKVLIYSSKELFDKSSYVGRAEAHVIAYRCEEEYVVMKNRTSQYMPDRMASYTMERTLDRVERDEWTRDKVYYENSELNLANVRLKPLDNF